MNKQQFLNGQLLIAQPRNQVGPFSKSVILIAQHGATGAWGVIVNRMATSIDMTNVMSAAGIDYPGNESVYIGGPVEPTRVHVIHTLDWSSPGTLRISDNIGITGDVSILAAISQGTGPTLYRAGVGLAVWSAGQLDGEQSGIIPWNENHKWLTTPATIELCLTGAGEDQWQDAINASVSKSVEDFF